MILFYMRHFFFFFLLSYFQSKLKKKIFLKIKKFSFNAGSSVSVVYLGLIDFLCDKFKKFQSRIGRGFFLKEFFESVFFFFICKDSSFFSHWLKKTMERVFFKNHKKLLYFISLFFVKYDRALFHIFGIKGVIISVGGKISLAGSAKKKKYLLRAGCFSLTKKSLKLSYADNFIWTSQGALGLKLFLFFN